MVEVNAGFDVLNRHTTMLILDKLLLDNFFRIPNHKFVNLFYLEHLVRCQSFIFRSIKNNTLQVDTHSFPHFENYFTNLNRSEFFVFLFSEPSFSTLTMVKLIVQQLEDPRGRKLYRRNHQLLVRQLPAQRKWV